MNPTSQQVYALAVSVLAGAAIPAVVDLVVKSAAPHWLKALAAFALANLAGALATVTIAPGETWSQFALAIGTAFVSAMSAHATGYSNPIQRRTAGAGIGQHRKAA